MNITKLDVAIAEAYRFIDKAKAARVKLEDEPTAAWGSKETSAAKRSSMDLTRSLSELRKT